VRVVDGNDDVVPEESWCKVDVDVDVEGGK
jgi:hypothetical protein